MSKLVRVNVTTRVNTDAIRREQRNDREVIIVPSATMPDDIVMNGVKYPAAEIRGGYASLDNTPAPYGHPETSDGAFLSALDPVAINKYWVGAHNENVRQQKDGNGKYRVHVDKVIDVEVAERTEAGREVLNAIEQGEPIHTSTGLWANIEAVDADDHEFVASDVVFDHDAILLHQSGAATPEQGVGMMVNKDGKKVEVDFINSVLERADEEVDWAASYLFRALEEREKATLIDRFKSLIVEMFSQDRGTTQNNKEPIMDEKLFQALSERVDSIAKAVETMQNSAVTTDNIVDTVTNAIKPLTDNIAATREAQANKEKAELDELVTKIVKANMMSEDAAKELTLNAARDIASKIKGGSADTMASGFQSNNDDEFAGYNPNDHLKEAS